MQRRMTTCQTISHHHTLYVYSLHKIHAGILHIFRTIWCDVIHGILNKALIMCTYVHMSSNRQHCISRYVNQRTWCLLNTNSNLSIKLVLLAASLLLLLQLPKNPPNSDPRYLKYVNIIFSYMVQFGFKGSRTIIASYLSLYSYVNVTASENKGKQLDYCNYIWILITANTHFHQVRSII